LRWLVEEGQALGLLVSGEDEVTLAWHEAQYQFRRHWHTAMAGPSMPKSRGISDRGI